MGTQYVFKLILFSAVNVDKYHVPKMTTVSSAKSRGNITDAASARLVTQTMKPRKSHDDHLHCGLPWTNNSLSLSKDLSFIREMGPLYLHPQPQQIFDHI